VACSSACIGNASARVTTHLSTPTTQKLTITATALKKRRLFIRQAIVAAWWPNAQFPLAVAVQFLVDGQPRGGRLQGEVRRYDSPDERVKHYVYFPAGVQMPLPLDSRVTAFRLVAPSSVEVHCTAGGGGEQQVGGGNSGGQQRAATLSAALAQLVQDARQQQAAARLAALAQAQAAQQQRAPQHGPLPAAPMQALNHAPLSAVSAAPLNAAAAAAQAAAGLASVQAWTAPTAATMSLTAAQAARQEAVIAAAAAAAAAIHQAPPPPTNRPLLPKLQPAEPDSDALPSAGAALLASTSTPPPAAVVDPSIAAALRALSLVKVEVPATCDDVALLQDAAAAVFEEVHRVGEALGLPAAVTDAACCGVDAATQDPVACRRFVRMEYLRLLWACAAGEVGVVRGWMERMVARGRDGADM